jgi:hypothetical protein
MSETIEQQLRAARVHDVKCWPDFFDKVASGKKTFEVRRDDRNYMLGDYLLLREFEVKPRQEDSDYTGRELTVEVTYVMRGRPNNPIAVGFCVMAIRPVRKSEVRAS